jgi:adenine-specific DNA-methyltransferase
MVAASVVDRVVDWATSVRCEPLGADLVPGASRAERQSLAALGGLTCGLIGSGRSQLPEPLHCWLEGVSPAPTQLVAAVKRQMNKPDDVLASIYERLVSGTSRRRLGTFFTPPSVVKFMVQQAHRMLPNPSQVLDPGAGVGAFTVAAARRWPKAAVVAIDTNVVTLGLLAARCAKLEPRDRVHLVCDDYLNWITSMRDAEQQRPSLLLGNPPYTRHQELDAKSKRAAREASGGLVDSGLAGLAAYFVATSLSAMRDEDALCFVLPGSWTEARYGRPIREWLWKATHRSVDLLAFPSSLEVFPGTRVTSMLLLVGPTNRSVHPMTIGSVSFVGGRLKIDHKIDRRRTGTAPDEFGQWLWPRRSLRIDGTMRLGQLAKVRRGVATGANHFFFLRDEDRKELPKRAARPALRRMRHVTGDVLDKAEHDRIGKAGHPRWLLWLADSTILADPKVKNRLVLGKRAGCDKTYLATDREFWYAVEDVKPPDILVAPMSSGHLRAILNVAKVVPSNSMYGLYVNDPTHAAKLCEWLNSIGGQQALRARARHYNGLMKLEPKDYLKVVVPDHVVDGAM